MKVTGQIEQIFSHAVHLDQNGGLKNTIYADKREVYILNYDHTVLLRFRLGADKSPFSEPISFKASDFDSNEFSEEDGKIIFLTTQPGFVRKKSCGKAEYSPEEVRNLFLQYNVVDREDTEKIVLPDSVLNLLDINLSHIEFSGNKGESIKMVQRNIYSGGIIEVTQQQGGMFNNELSRDIGPIGIKTNDFMSLFEFQEALRFYFPSRGKDDYIVVHSLDKKKMDMVGIIACCLYDEIIKIKEVLNGGQEQKIWRRK